MPGVTRLSLERIFMLLDSYFLECCATEPRRALRRGGVEKFLPMPYCATLRSFQLLVKPLRAL